MMNRAVKSIAILIASLLLISLPTACKKDDAKSTGSATKETSKATTTTAKVTTPPKTTGKTTDKSTTGTPGTQAEIPQDNDGDQEPGDDDETPSGEIPSDDEDTEEEVIDFNGRTFVYRTSSGWRISEEHGRELWRTLSASIDEACKKYNCTLQFEEMANLNEMINALVAGLYVGDFTMNGASYRVLPTWMNAGIIMPLDDIIDFEDPIISRLPHELTKVAGYHWGFLWHETMPGPHLIYNKDLVLREGIQDLFVFQQEGTWTWDKLLEVAIATTRDLNGDGITDQWGFDNLDNFTKLCWTTIISNGGSIYDWDNTANQFELSVYNSNTLEALQFISDLIHVYKVAPKDPEWGGNTSRYFLGQSAMAHWTNPNLQRFGLCPQNSGLVVYPKGPKAEDYTADTTTWFICVFANAKNPEEVGKFLSRAFVTWDPDKEAYFDPDTALAEVTYFFSDNDKISYQLAADKMCDIVKGVQSDPGFMGGNLFTLMNPKTNPDSGSISSVVASSEMILRNNVDQMNEAVRTALNRLQNR